MKNSHKFWIIVFMLTWIIGSVYNDVIFTIFLWLQGFLGVLILFVILNDGYEDVIEDAQEEGLMWIIVYFNITSITAMIIIKFNNWLDNLKL